MPFVFKKLEIPDLVLVEFQTFGDSRGFFAETYKRSEFAENGIPEEFVQDNFSRSVRGVVRGLHYQKEPKAQGKFVRVAKGEVFEVAVDIRRGSLTYGKWVSEILSEENHRMLWIPPGFALGFCVLSEECDLSYKVTNEFSLELDRGIAWNDPEVGVRWPVEQPILSEKDKKLPQLKNADINFDYKG